MRRYPSRAAASRTRSAVVSEIVWLRGCPDSTYDTVAIETPAAAATVRKVGLSVIPVDM
jgi:hypothetical protein